MSKHTPGPWRYEHEFGFCGALISANGTIITEFINEPRPANARLIAAAPDLLEALKGMLDNCYDTERDDATFKAVVFARAAIAKATGEQQ